ncbi:hypothetical protein NPIL_465361 [Nephila pilipes]|uniref:Integrase catalytic domain-containing protein n=1 Tax=Nephila pilipes TaxID=299642 RepID=A0A8X6U5Y7_NEPPI|nr:hypothetical protein NPIL_465361 [Nephila pilipes]
MPIRIVPLIARLLGVKRILTTAYHPQSNGLIEDRPLRQQLCATQLKNGRSSSYYSPRASLKENIGCTLAEWMNGKTLR